MVSNTIGRQSSQLRHIAYAVAALMVAVFSVIVGSSAANPASSGAAASVTAVSPGVKPAANVANDPAQPPSTGPARSATAQERAYLRDTPVGRIANNAKAAPTPNTSVAGSNQVRQWRDGPERKVAGSTNSAAAGSAARLAGDNPNQSAPLWPGAYNSNPNRQVGRLFFYDPGRGDTSWCSATAITSQNKSTVVTAGHCVFNPDPDGNGVINGNGYWKRNFVFCPGYEFGCKLGSWNFRKVATTSTWFYGAGAAHRYDFSDDVAYVVVQRNSAGSYLTDAVGSQGVWFNGPTNVARTALGYPATDSRWPAYSYDPRDLRYCQNTDRVDSKITGTLWIPCTMTGGASGGPWLTWVNANTWLGYVNSVNSHKPYGGAFMSGPYFGSAESSLYTTYQKA